MLDMHSGFLWQWMGNDQDIDYISLADRKFLLRFYRLGAVTGSRSGVDVRRTLSRASMIGLVTGVVCFFLALAFLTVFVIILGALRHNHPDMGATLKIAFPVAALTAVLGFVIAVVRLRTIDKHTLDKHR